MSQDLPRMSVQEVAERLGKPGFYVFDNNHRRRWAAGHVPGARHLDPGGFTAGDLPPDRDATLVFYCSGPR
ncbi:MAG: rhodanese-like domain-containing protein [Armatimonadota bacterium]|nr:rhodanese-like domain-containing protein [Armatimonadota bacterium]MDR7439779.1 rhodanese-like domain-containing protein [Armatimonadota bacterium]MDR7562260.1 rhodanese-like domain-containing protein [Armatimonadota bacterium]MDR7603017.1 rhodanese-like domain-containing protein [Armatimonadota bacterium]